jgi:LuxR family transcriptional regulator, maltose regulon positive regulatory protein
MDRQWSLQGRLSPPSYRVALLERPALARLQAAGLAHKAVLISAPAGYGKTACLSQWRTILQGHSIPIAWITLTPTDSDPSQLLTYLTMGLVSAGVELGPLENLAQAWFADTPVEAAIGSLINYLAQESRQVVIVLDDVHYASRVITDAVIAPLLVPGLQHVHLVFGCRGRPLLSLAALRSRGELLEVNSDALRFDDDALRALLPELTERQRELLALRTEGWPVALQLARLWLAARPARVGLIEGFSGQTAEVADYLTEQVLGDLPPITRETLELISPLDVLCAGIVEAVTEVGGAWEAIVSLPALAHLLVPLDETGEWYRLHPLLAGYLRDRLRRRRAALETRCHALASTWFESKAMILEAVRHAVAAGDVSRASSLIEGTGGWELVNLGGAALLRALLAEFPSDQLTQYPRVELFRAFMDAKSGLLADSQLRLEDASATLNRAGTQPGFASPAARDLLIVTHLVSGYRDNPLPPNALMEIYAQIEAVPQTDAKGRAALLNIACLIGLRLGNMPAAHDVCTRAVREMRALDSLLGVNYCLLHRGLASFHLGQRREAEAIFREAIELADENFGTDSGLRALADVLLAVAIVARGDHQGATALLDRSLPQVEVHDGWLDIYAEAYGAATAIAFAAGAFERAEEYIRRGIAVAERRGLSRLQRLLNSGRVRAFVRLGQYERAHAECRWQRGEWQESPYRWRECHEEGISAVECELATGHPDKAFSILEDLRAAATEGSRVRDIRKVGLLEAAARYATGERDKAAEAVVEILESALLEDDTGILVESSTSIASLLQHAKRWALEHGGSSLVRQALTQALLVPNGKLGSPIDLLSSREMEVLRELVQGSPNKIIARALQMTENTVKFHLKNVFQKLGVKHRAQAIRAAQDHGLVR